MQREHNARLAALEVLTDVLKAAQEDIERADGGSRDELAAMQERVDRKLTVALFMADMVREAGDA